MVKARQVDFILSNGQMDLESAFHALTLNKEDKEIELLNRAWTLVTARGQVKTPLMMCGLTLGIQMGLLLNDLGLDTETVVAALVFHTYRYGKIKNSAILETLNEKILNLILNVEKMQDVHHKTHYHRTENLRILLLAVVEDIRSVLIKLAEHTCVMREIIHIQNDELRKEYAEETQVLYAPLANRLGIGQIKWELEDVAFRILEPPQYKHIAQLLDGRRIDRENYIEKVVVEIKKILAREKIDSQLVGRAKHIFSIWKKMQRKGVSYNQIYDVHAIRIIVPTVRDCYAALCIIHDVWQHIPKEFDDYIANPKSNGYQSLHTAVTGPLDKTIEVQIRTQEMHNQAELGIAAHWRYKEYLNRDTFYETRLLHLRKVLTWQEGWAKDSPANEDIKRAVFQEKVYVLTPKGRIIDLPQGATVLDFAYHIHTDIGHHSRGAQVNHKAVPLNYILKSGDQVEVMTSKYGGPSREWLKPELCFLQTLRARNKVLQWFKRMDRTQNIIEGREILERELRREGITCINLEVLAENMKLGNTENLLACIGAGDLRMDEILNTLDHVV